MCRAACRATFGGSLLDQPSTLSPSRGPRRRILLGFALTVLAAGASGILAGSGHLVGAALVGLPLVPGSYYLMRAISAQGERTARMLEARLHDAIESISEG